MRFSGFLVIVLAVLVLFISPSASHADSFISYYLGQNSLSPNYGIGPAISIDGNGLLYSYPPYSYWEYGYNWNNWGPCGNKNIVHNCYEVQNLYTGDFVGFTSTIPALDYGKPCTLSIPGEVGARCSNNGEYVLFDEDNSLGNPIGTFIGYYGTGVFSNTDSFTDIDPGRHDAGDSAINGRGDAVIFGSSEDSTLAVANLSNDPFNTPEPGSFILLSSGALALFGALRRRSKESKDGALNSFGRSHILENLGWATRQCRTVRGRTGERRPSAVVSHV